MQSLLCFRSDTIDARGAKKANHVQRGLARILG